MADAAHLVERRALVGEMMKREVGDRVNAYFPLGHGPGGFRSWWRQLHDGSDELLDNTHLMRMAGRFARRLRAGAEANGIPVIDCGRGERKHLIAEEYLATHEVGTGVFLILVAKAPAPVWKVTRSAQGKIVNLEPKIEYVNHYSFHIMDPAWGHLTFKMSGHPPFGAQVILNGHEYVACAARSAGVAFAKEGNCFTLVYDPPALAQIADTLSQQAAVGRLSQVCNQWIYTACLCFGLDLDEQARSGFRYDYSIHQMEYSRNLLFGNGARMERVFDAVVDRTRSRLDVPKLRHLFGAKARRQSTASPRPRRRASPAGSRDRDTCLRPDHLQAPLRPLDVEGVHQRRTRAALRGHRAQHQGATLRAGVGQVRRDS